MQEMYGQSMARTSFTLVMLAIAGAMALLLGVIGIYGVISYAVSQRRREIGIRLALGAQRGELRWMFVRSALVLTGVGVGIGVVAAAGLTQTMKSLLFGVSPAGPGELPGHSAGARSCGRAGQLSAGTASGKCQPGRRAAKRVRQGRKDQG